LIFHFEIFLIILNIIFINLKLSAEENLNYDTEITTDSGITLYQNEKYYELIDNVKIKSQNFNLKAENVIAYYKDDLYDLVKIIAKKNAEIDTLDGAIITGDETQIDLHNRDFSGLKKTRKSLSNIEEISVVEFKNSDIVRNKIVSKILEVFPDK